MRKVVWMEDMDKAIEIMKAAMEKEKVMKEKREEAMDQQIDEEAGQETQNTEAEEEMVTEGMAESDKVEVSEMETEADAAEEAEGKQDKAGKSFFRNSKTKELAAKDQKIEELTDRLMRTMAEFDNFRKRTEKEKTMMYDMGVKSIIEKILPIVDNFERGLGTITEKEKESAFAQGIELIYRQLLTSLDEIGVKPIDAVGKEFDPNLHNAVMHGEDENLGENIVSDVFQKGYLYRDTVVRHSMVKVVN
jgi:molecular chaperone GrpE